ncbi:hypothetical protein [Kosakonia sacchari]|uniref:hypothetical protein n=1 Tax=Kosakonia sacchari TaxID=1158459 RepID=UPI0013621B4B|nr:hypothetical protein [Kosakonia sacchari]QHM95982.1 hypothetical protein FGE25_17685 [Kosakonia sacchari]
MIIKQLSGAAGDVLHALFFRGALVDGDLPSKAGAAELRELGYVKTRDTLTPFCGEHHFNFLTPAGQAFAISYLVDSHFGELPVFRIGGGEGFINNALISATLRNRKTDSAPRLMEPLEQAALTERINQVVNDAIANALKPGGLLYARK